MSRPVTTSLRKINFKRKWRRKPISRWVLLEMVLVFAVLGFVAVAPWLYQPIPEPPARYPDGSGVGV